MYQSDITASTSLSLLCLLEHQTAEPVEAMLMSIKYPM